MGKVPPEIIGYHLYLDIFDGPPTSIASLQKEQVSVLSSNEMRDLINSDKSMKLQSKITDFELGNIGETQIMAYDSSIRTLVLNKDFEETDIKALFENN